LSSAIVRAKLGLESAPRPERRIRIADATLSVLAKEGARHLTHRMIDRALGLPEGSTSNYCRTRMELLTSAANRLFNLDLEDLHWQVEMGKASADSVPSEKFADRYAEVIIDWLRPAKLDRTLARCELFLEATRDPVLKTIMYTTRGEFQRRNQLCFRAIGAKHPEKAAVLLIHFVFGVLYSRAVAPSRRVNRAELKNLTRSTISVLKTQ
jgi:DNA-binding transcriptional regulator YbjK